MVETASAPGIWSDETKQIILAHAVLVGLTPLIPIPILDDFVKDYVERRLAGEIGRRHGHALPEETVRILVGAEDEGLFKTIAVGIVKLPFSLVFRKLFVVLEIKRASDEASRAFHYAYLLDYALRMRRMTPAGERTPREVRSAIVGACKEARLSPMTTAFSAVFAGSKDLVGQLAKSFIGKLRPKSGDSIGREGVASAVEATNEGALGPIVSRLTESMNAIPGRHFRALEERFDSLLGVRRS
ncbi:MAG: hypothetical protein HOW73_24255 [Polyangiaceae bacterium]|nr:hypothetical protein [Polyangiaceae bacterium]